MVHKINFNVSLVPSVIQSPIERHLQAENILFCESFAYDHQNYAHYGAFQHVNLQSLTKEDKEPFNKPKEKESGSCLTEYVFSTIHSDLVTELFNKETKSNTGSLRCDFSTNIDLVNTWLIRFIYIPCLKLVNPSIHKKDCQTFGLIVDIFLKLEVAFHLLLPLYLYQSQLLMES